MKHIISDRHGYWAEIEASSPDEAVRSQSLHRSGHFQLITDAVTGQLLSDVSIPS